MDTLLEGRIREWGWGQRSEHRQLSSAIQAGNLCTCHLSKGSKGRRAGGSAMASVWDGHNCDFYLASEEKTETPSRGPSAVQRVPYRRSAVPQ